MMMAALTSCETEDNPPPIPSEVQKEAIVVALGANSELSEYVNPFRLDLRNVVAIAPCLAVVFANNSVLAQKSEKGADVKQ